MTEKGTIRISLVVNGCSVTGKVEPRTQLCEFLRETLNLTGTHVGCEQGVCGACTIVVDGKPQRSCLSYGGDCDGSAITTIEGFDDDSLMEQLRDAFSRHHALQCGYCTPGMLVTARDIVQRLGEVNAPRIREELAGNLCRCTGYVGIVEAIEEVSRGKQPGERSRLAVKTSEFDSPLIEANLPPQVISLPARNPTLETARGDRKGWSSIEQDLNVGFPADIVWAKLAGIRDVAKCVPGAEIVEIDGQHVVGQMKVSLGPMKVAFAGEGTIELDDVQHIGRMTGRGRDSGSGSSAEGEMEWQVRPSATSRDTSRLVVTLSWRLSGRLAQFNRAGLVRDVIQRLASMFTVNLEASIKGEPSAVASQPLGIWSLLWSVFSSRLRRWRGR
jgi:carbon-monoxide dehydrogenase small subunit